MNAGRPVPSKDGCWKKIWINILSQNLQFLDLSSAEFDGSHTPAKNGGDGVGYQAGRPVAAKSIQHNKYIIFV
jgi:hypothetical protein